MPRPMRRVGKAGGALAAAACASGAAAAPEVSVGDAIATALPGLGGLLVLLVAGTVLGYRRAEAGSRARPDPARVPR